MGRQCMITLSNDVLEKRWICDVRFEFTARRDPNRAPRAEVPALGFELVHGPG